MIEGHTPSDPLFSKELYTVSSLSDPAEKQRLNSTDSLRERLNQF